MSFDIARDRPWCAVCDKPVEELRWWDPLDRLHTRRFVAECHGEIEQVDVNLRLFFEMPGGQGKPAVRFVAAFVRA